MIWCKSQLNYCVLVINSCIFNSTIIFLIIYFLEANYFTILYWFAIHWHESAMGVHVFLILNSPSIPFLWVILMNQPRASWIMHRTCTGDSFHIWYYTCFSAILPNHPTLALSHRVQKTVLYICVFFAVLHTGSSLPSF